MNPHVTDNHISYSLAGGHLIGLGGVVAAEGEGDINGDQNHQDPRHTSDFRITCENELDRRRKSYEAHFWVKSVQ